MAAGQGEVRRKLELELDAWLSAAQVLAGAEAELAGVGRRDVRGGPAVVDEDVPRRRKGRRRRPCRGRRGRPARDCAGGAVAPEQGSSRRG